MKLKYKLAFTDHQRQGLKKRVLKIPIKRKHATIPININATSNEFFGPSENEISSSDSQETSLEVIGLNLTDHALDHLEHDIESSSLGNETESSENIEEPTLKVVVKKVKKVKKVKNNFPNEIKEIENENGNLSNEVTNQIENSSVTKTKKKLVKKTKLSQRKNSTRTEAKDDEIRRIQDDDDDNKIMNLRLKV